MLEVAKRQLHLRLKSAKTPEELYTFAMLVHGNKFEQYVVYFKDGFYGYTNISKFDFPCPNSITLVDNALELLLGFKGLMLGSIVDTSESPSSSLYEDKASSLIPTTSYCHKTTNRDA